MGNNSQFLRSRPQTRPAIVRLACGAILLGLLFWFWYRWAADYGYRAISGTYIFHDNGEQATLVLLESRVFRQELSHPGTVEQAEGTWRRVGEGGVVFSNEFLKVGGQRVRRDGQTDGQVKKTFGGLFLSIVFNGDKGGPVFHKKVFR
jgi:hypothetical protein